MEEEGSRYRFLEDEAFYYDPKSRRKYEVRRKKRHNHEALEVSSVSSKAVGILKRHPSNTLSTEPPNRERLKKISPLSSDEERLHPIPHTKFDAVRKPWSSLKDQTKQSVITIPRRSRSLTEARQGDKSNSSTSSSLPFKTRVTSALKPKASSSLTPTNTSSSSHQLETPSLMTTLTTSIRNKAQKLQSVAPPQSLPFLSPPRIEVTAEEEDPQRSILKSTSQTVNLCEPLSPPNPALLHRVVTFSIPPGKRRTSLSSLSSSTPDLRSPESHSNNNSNSRQSSFDSEDQEGDGKIELVLSELRRQSPKGKSDSIYYWISERERLMKEVEGCLLKLRGVSRIIEEHLLEQVGLLPAAASSIPPICEKIPERKVISNLSDSQISFLSLPKSYSFPFLCESQRALGRYKSWPRLITEESESPPLFQEISNNSNNSEDVGDSNWDICMNRLSVARETSILSEDELVERRGTL